MSPQTAFSTRSPLFDFYHFFYLQFCQIRMCPQTAYCLILRIWDFTKMAYFHPCTSSALCFEVHPWWGALPWCLLSRVYRISFQAYTRIHLSNILLVDIGGLFFFQHFTIPSHAVMTILIHVPWCTCLRVLARYRTNVKFYLYFTT